MSEREPGERGPGAPGEPGATAEPGQPGATAEPVRVVEAVDPDVDLHVPQQRAETAGRRVWAVLGAIAVGGALGSAGRYALSLALPAGTGGFPWGVFAANVLGCGLIGILMVLVSEGGRAERTHPPVRPFLGVGVLGGFTTFSTYAVGVAELLDDGPAAGAVAVGYLGGTLAAALAAVWTAAALTRALLAGRAARAGREPGGRS